MTGPIPSEFGQCSQLSLLALPKNQLTGSWDFAIVMVDGKRVYNCLVGFAGTAEFSKFMATKVPTCRITLARR